MPLRSVNEATIPVNAVPSVAVIAVGEAGVIGESATTASPWETAELPPEELIVTETGNVPKLAYVWLAVIS